MDQPRKRMSWEDGAVYARVLLGLAIYTFSILAMGQNVVGENEGVAELFLYAGATGVLIGLVLLMPPYRGPNWISQRGTGR